MSVLDSTPEDSDDAGKGRFSVPIVPRASMMQAIAEPEKAIRVPPSSRRMRRLFRSVLIATVVLFAVVVLGLYGSTVYFVHKAFSHRVEKLEHVPQDLGLQGESVALTSADGIPLKAWWIPAEHARGAVLVLHGMDGLDASCLLPQAKFLHEAGWSALLLDMRAHGRSGGSRIWVVFGRAARCDCRVELARYTAYAAKQAARAAGILYGGSYGHPYSRCPARC